MNAIEAQHEFQYNKSWLVIRSAKHKRADIQILKLIGDVDCFSTVIFLSILNRWQHIKAFRLYFLILKTDGDVFLGDIRSGFLRPLLKIIRQSRIWLLDDGFATITSDVPYNRYSLFPPTLVSGGGATQFLKNEFNHFKSKINTHQNINDNLVYFLGSPIVELKIVDESYFFSQMSSIQRHYEAIGSKLLYYSHRTDSLEKMRKIEDMGIDVVVLDEVFEFHLVSSTCLPGTIVSFYSTTLYTTGLLQPLIKRESVRLSTDKLSSKYQNNVESVYTELDGLGVGRLVLD